MKILTIIISMFVFLRDIPLMLSILVPHSNYVRGPNVNQKHLVSAITAHGDSVCDVTTQKSTPFKKTF